MESILQYTQSLMHVMRNVHKGLHGNVSAKQELGTLTMQQFQTIMFIQNKRQVSMSEIADEMKVTPATATSLVDRLVKKKLLMRTVPPENRRNVYISLSDHAKIHFEKMMKEKLETLSKVFAQMTQQDRADLLRALTSLSHIVDKNVQ